MAQVKKNTDSNAIVGIRIFFLAASLTTALIGTALLVSPSLVTNIFLDYPLEDSGLFFIRFAGTSLLGFSFLNYYASIKQPSFLKTAAVVNIVSLAPATLISIWTYSSGYIDSYKWLIILEHSIFLAGFIASWLLLRVKIPIAKDS